MRKLFFCFFFSYFFPFFFFFFLKSSILQKYVNWEWAAVRIGRTTMALKEWYFCRGVAFCLLYYRRWWWWGSQWRSRRRRWLVKKMKEKKKKKASFSDISCDKPSLCSILVAYQPLREIWLAEAVESWLDVIFFFFFLGSHVWPNNFGECCYGNEGSFIEKENGVFLFKTSKIDSDKYRSHCRK